MKNPYEVCLWAPENKYSSRNIVMKVSKRFKNYGPAKKFAERLNRKHCQETQHGRRCNKWVDIHKNGSGCIEELQAVLVPSVGELGYTP